MASGFDGLPVRQRLLAIGAHPDDLVLGASALLGRAQDAYCLVLTTGARRGDPPALAATRRTEDLAAMAELGLPPEHSHCLGLYDQDSHRRLDRLIAALEGWMCRLRPAWVLVHDYEQGHPDHDAAAFAAAITARSLGIPCYVYPLYHRQDGELRFCQFRGTVAGERAHRLSNLDLSRKFRALSAYVSQMNVIKDFPLHCERVRPFDAACCQWRKTGESAYQRIPSIAVEPGEVLSAICHWLASHPPGWPAPPQDTTTGKLCVNE